jgi:nickel-dependent lactate racemase
MKIDVAFAREHLKLEVPESRLVALHQPQATPPIEDPAAAVRDALETPLGFPALRRALTPDDHVTIVVDQQLPRLPEMLTAVLEHVTAAGVVPSAITLLCPPSPARQEWVDALPDACQEVRVEVHDPTDRRRLAYLATTKQGRRIYLNRTAVDADQLVVLGRRRYDPLLGYAGAEGALYPALADEATREEMCGRLSLAVPGETPWPVRQEAAEVAWLLGVPFFVQVIEGAADEIAHVIAGPAETSREGDRLLDARWRKSVDRPADTVIAAVSGDPARHTFADLGRALACAARVVQPNGRVILLTRARPELGAAGDLLRQAEDPGRALGLLRKNNPPEMAAAFQWASAAQRASIYLLSDLDPDTAEELFTVPLEDTGQVQRLLQTSESCLFLADAHKALPVIGE